MYFQKNLGLSLHCVANFLRYFDTVRIQSIVISVSACLLAYLKNHMSKFHPIFC